MGQVNVQLPRSAPARSIGSGAGTIVIGFGVVVAVGFLLLMLPWASSDGTGAEPRVALFTAVSAICVTGLVLVETDAHWSGFGEVVILALIQVGGLGYMLGTTVVLWAFGRRLGLRDRHMLRLYYGAPSLGETLSFARGVGLFALAFEAAGAIILAIAFMIEGLPPGQSLWWGIFHSVSAFNNAGFSVTGYDMIEHAGDSSVLVTLIILVVAGSIGFLPLTTLARRRSWGRLPLDHKLIFATSALLLVAGAAFITAVEWRNDDTLGQVARHDRPLVGLFQSTNARSAGFSAVDNAEATDETKVSMVGLMFVGGAAGSTAGGLKVGAFSMLLAVMIATFRGQTDVTAFRRKIPPLIVRQATTLALYFVGLLFAFTITLTVLSDAELIDVLFEAMSALGTVGFSAAGTSSFSGAAQFVLMVAMVTGRFSPLILVLYMTKARQQDRYHYPDDSVRLG